MRTISISLLYIYAAVFDYERQCSYREYIEVSLSTANEAT